MTTENDFFKAKRPWSKIKDEVLRNYLVPYLTKVAQLRQRIIFVGAFAGKGVFIPHWKLDQIRQLQISLLPKSVQQKISYLVRKSHEACKKAKQLLEEAKQKVEKMISEEK